MNPSKILTTSLLAALVALASPRNASAAESAVTGPNRSMLESGAWTLGVGYVPAHDAERDCPDCDHETLNKVLLVTDGVVQGVGALQIVGSFLFLETRSASAPNRTKAADVPNLRFVPARLDAGG
jgi:hypothetical protein